MFFIKNQLTAAFINGRSSFRLGQNIQSLKCHLDGSLIEIGKLKEEPRIIALTETWLGHNDSAFASFLAEYQPRESKPRTSVQEKGGVASYVQ